MKNRFTKSVTLLLIFWKGFKDIFKKKYFQALDNVDPIMNLLTEGDFKKLSVEERIAIKMEIDRRFHDDMTQLMADYQDDLIRIKQFLNPYQPLNKDYLARKNISSFISH